jgi:hypothetical protein
MAHVPQQKYAQSFPWSSSVVGMEVISEEVSYAGSVTAIFPHPVSTAISFLILFIFIPGSTTSGNICSGIFKDLSICPSHLLMFWLKSCVVVAAVYSVTLPQSLVQFLT